MFGADWLISSNPAFKNKTSIIQLSNFISKQLCFYPLFSSKMRLLWYQVWKFWVRAQPSVLPLCYHRLQAPQPPSTYYSRTFTSIIRISKYVHFQNHLYLFLKAYKIEFLFENRTFENQPVSRDCFNTLSTRIGENLKNREFYAKPSSGRKSDIFVAC